MGSHRDRLQTGSAKAIHSNPGHRNRQSGQHRHPSRDVQALRPVRLRTAENDIFDFRRIERRRFLQHIPNAMCGQLFRTCHIEGPAKGLRKARTRTGNDYSFSHAVIIEASAQGRLMADVRI